MKSVVYFVIKTIKIKGINYLIVLTQNCLKRNQKTIDRALENC